MRLGRWMGKADAQTVRSFAFESSLRLPQTTKNSAAVGTISRLLIRGAAALLAKRQASEYWCSSHYAAGGFTHVFHMFDYLTEGRLDWQPSPMSTIASLSAICVSPTDGESRVCATN